MATDACPVVACTRWIGFTALANQLALAGLGIATLGLVVLGLGLMFSIFDRGVMSHMKDGLLRIIGGSAIVGGAGVVHYHKLSPVMTTKTTVDKIGVAPVQTCDWRDCTVFPTFRVVQWDTETQNENDATARYMCLEHARQVLTEPET